MRKAQFKNFRYFFLLIFFLHLSMLFLHMNKMSEPDDSPALKVRILKNIDTSRQIVESEDPEDETRPKDQAKMSDKNRAFDRETRARNLNKFQKGRDLSLSALGGDISKKDPFQRAAKEYAAAKNGKKQNTGGRVVSSTNDYLEEIPLGDTTHLNTVEYKFYGYYHRIKQKLEGFWGRSVQEKAELLAGQGRMIASDENHVTALRIVMDPAGEIVDVVILGSSGVKELDDAAIESFNQAGPFPNPPKDLIVDGRVTIEWGFVVNS